MVARSSTEELFEAEGCPAVAVALALVGELDKPGTGAVEVGAAPAAPFAAIDSVSADLAAGADTKPDTAAGGRWLYTSARQAWWVALAAGCCHPRCCLPTGSGSAGGWPVVAD